jgi:predicted nucleic acid-binding protein
MIYLDSAAVVKLVHAEPESAALRGWLDERAETGWISSVLVELESFRALARYAPDAVSRLPAVLDQIDLIDLDPGIRILAQTAKPATVRSLDAIHLGTALQARPGLISFVTYHKRLLDAASAAGLPVDSPWERSSRLGLTWGNGAWVGCCPQVKRGWPTRSGGSCSGSGGSAGAVPGAVASGSSGGRPRRWRG